VQLRCSHLLHLTPYPSPPHHHHHANLSLQAAKNGEVTSLQRTIGDLRAHIDRLSAQTAGLEAGAAQQHGELATLRRLAQLVTDSEAAFTAVAPSLALSTATIAAAAASPGDGGGSGAAAGERAGASPQADRRDDGSGQAGDPSIKAANHAARLGRQAGAAVEAAVAWLESAPLADGAPGLASAIRRLLSLLRTAGVALVEVGGVVAADGREKRQQRHALYDEIHALKQEVSGRGWGREEPAVCVLPLRPWWRARCCAFLTPACAVWLARVAHDCVASARALARQ